MSVNTYKIKIIIKSEKKKSFLIYTLIWKFNYYAIIYNPTDDIRYEKGSARNHKPEPDLGSEKGSSLDGFELKVKILFISKLEKEKKCYLRHKTAV